jgi:hypothetical protein
VQDLMHNARDSEVIWCRCVYCVALLARPIPADNLVEDDVAGYDHLASLGVDTPCCRWRNR